MSDYDDMMNDYDWYQNTGELREYFEDDEPDYYQGGHQQSNTPNYNSSSYDYIGCVIAFLVVCVIALVVILLW